MANPFRKNTKCTVSYIWFARGTLGLENAVQRLVLKVEPVLEYGIRNEGSALRYLLLADIALREAQCDRPDDQKPPKPPDVSGLHGAA